MRLTFLGTRSEKQFPRKGMFSSQDHEARRMKDKFFNYRQSSLLVEHGDKQVRIDAGIDWTGDLSTKEYVALVFSHAHVDHCAALREFHDSEVPFPIWSAKPILNELKKTYNLKGEFLELPQNLDGIIFESIKVAHSSLTPTIAIKFNQIIYAPDYLRFLEPEKLRGAKMLIIDGSSLRRDIKRDRNVGHASIESSLITAEKFGIKELIVTHIGHHGMAFADFNLAVAELGKKYEIKTSVARDGMSIEIPLFEKEQEHLSEQDRALFKIEGYDPEKLSDEVLIEDQRLIAAKYSTMRRGGKTEFDSIDAVVDFGEKVVKELFARGKMKYSWENLRPLTKELLLRILPRLTSHAIHFPAPQGDMLLRGAKIAIVKPKQYEIAPRPFGILQGNKLIGYARFKEPKEIDLRQFRATTKWHRITDTERNEIWPKINRFFLYPVKDRFPLLKPKVVKIKAGSNTFVQLIKNIGDIALLNLPPARLTDISNLQVIALHGKIHDLYETRGKRINDEPVINSHLLIVKEMRKRKLEHRFVDSLDNQLLLAKIDIDDVKEYFTDLSLKTPFLSIIGSTAVNGRGNDLDIWVNWSDEAAKYFLSTLNFRLASMLPPELKSKLHLVPTPEQGPFTNYIELADLEVRFRPPEEWKVIRMQEQEQIKPLKPFQPMKASLSTAYSKSEFFSSNDAWKQFALPLVEGEE